MLVFIYIHNLSSLLRNSHERIEGNNHISEYYVTLSGAYMSSDDAGHYPTSMTSLMHAGNFSTGADQ